MSISKRFLKSERGYALILGLISLPLLLGLSLLVFDLSRATNAQTDLQAVVDAVALAGARELDGSPDSITRSKNAMTQVSNTVSFLGLAADSSIETLTYADANGNEFNVIFMDAIPASDDDDIDQAWIDGHGTNDPTLAAYVYVYAQTTDLETFFPMAVVNAGAEVLSSQEQNGLDIAAYAVATYSSSACDVTPLFICNPFETDPSVGGDLQTAFEDGKLHGRIVKLHPRGSTTAGPGTFGFLQVTGNNDNNTASADAIRDIFAGEKNPTCYGAGDVDTKPGAATSISQGINTRFDIFDGPYQNFNPNNTPYPPAVNVRKGYVQASNGSPSPCNTEPSSDPSQATGFGDNYTMVDPNPTNPGAYIGSGDWNLTGADGYWTVNHGTSTLPADLASSFPTAASPGTTMPSRYDVYRYEINNNLVGDTSPGGETGTPACYASKKGQDDPDPSDDPDRRLIFAAIINCNANPPQGSSTLPVEVYASIFLVNPMQKDPANPSEDSTIDVEIVDITGSSGNGTIEEFLREEALLVR